MTSLLSKLKDSPTEEEKALLQFYETREAEKKRALEQKKILALQLSQPHTKSAQESSTSRRFSAVSTLKKESSTKPIIARPNKPEESASIGSSTEVTNITISEEGSEPRIKNEKEKERKKESEIEISGIKPLDMKTEEANTSTVTEKPTDSSAPVVDYINRSYKRKRVAVTEEEEEINTLDSLSVSVPPPPAVPTTSLDPTLYPEDGLLLDTDYRPKEAIKKEKTSRKWRLKDFGLDNHQTLVFKVTVPQSSQRWSINIAPSDPGSVPCADTRLSDWTELLCHFNPRRGQKKSGLVLNDRTDGYWGPADLRPKGDLPSLFGVTLEIIIQILSEGFCVSFDGHPSVMFMHRRDISDLKSLWLELPLCDDYGNPEDVTFHKVWWGARPVINVAETDMERILYGTTTSLFIQGLPRVSDRESVTDLENMLWELFGDYEPEKITVITNNKGYAAMKVATPSLAHRAVKEMTDFVIQEEGSVDQYVLRVDIDVSAH